MPDPVSLTGRTVAHYQVANAIGSGGMAVVYLAEDLRHQRKVALKVLRPELAAVLGQDRFLREIATTASLRHPHILPLYDSGRIDSDAALGEELLYYVMPYVEGESLRDRLVREKQLPISDALRITREVADALSHAHGRGVIHRDIKPENILLDGNHAVVADFGIARAIDAAAATQLTTTGLTLGTPAYMSPEQAAGTRDLDGRSDVYALGCVLYEMLAGEPPFSAPTAERMIHQHLAVDPRPVTALRPTVPLPLQSALSRALAKIPADRFQTAAQFAAALDTEPTANAAAAHVPQQRTSAVWKFGAGIAVAIITVVTLWLTRGPAHEAAGSRIVVLPFASVAGDTSLQRMGRELAVAMTANLDGMGELQTIDAVTALAESPSGAAMSLDAAHEVARRVGAQRVIHGTLTHAGAEMRLDAALYDAGTSQAIARASVTAQDIPRLGDAVTIDLLDQLWLVEPPLAASLAAVRQSTVLAARRAYLTGELAYSRSQWQSAIDAFEQAFATDTTFWWAYWRTLYPRAYRETERADPQLIRKIVEHRNELPEPDRLLIEATRMVPSQIEQLERLRQLVDRFPDYELGWWEYANRLVHFGGYMGHASEVARGALERVLALNPRFIAAWDHLQWLAIVEGDSVTALRATEEAARLAEPSYRLEDQFRWLRVEFFGSELVSSERLDELADLLLQNPAGAARVIASGVASDGFPAIQIRLNRAARARTPAPEIAAHLWEGEALAWTARGAWDSALVAIRRLAQVPGATDAGLRAYRLAVAGTVFGGAPVDQAISHRPAAGADIVAELSWLDGVLSYSQRRQEGIAAARRALEVMAADTRPDSLRRSLLVRSLSAFELDIAGQRERAARELVAVETEIADRSGVRSFGERHPLMPSLHRILAAQWLRELGEDTEAYRLLAWYEAIPPGYMVGWNRSIGTIGLVYRAEIAEAAGDNDRAVRDFERFLALYDLPDQAMQEFVTRARDGLQRLTSEPGAHP